VTPRYVFILAGCDGSYMRFIVDEMLGKLGRWLRILGFDTEYCSPISDDELLRRSLAEDRVVLTRDRALMQRRAVRRGVLIQSEHLTEQLEEVFSGLRLTYDESALFSRCLLCNSLLETVSVNEVKGRVPAYVYETRCAFRRCPRCDRTYWQGTHWQHVCAALARHRLLKDRQSAARADLRS